jgi:alkylation response protein AidB-like acyl-CoA dehydrogenase
VAEAPRVDFTPTEEQVMLKETTRQFLQDQVSSEVVRAIAETDEGFDENLWKSTAGLGWHSLAIPEEYGGAGYSFVELSIVLEEMGRSLYAGPFLSTVVMAANAILMAGSDAQKRTFLPAVAAGEMLMSVALYEGPHSASVDEIALSATPSLFLVPTDAVGFVAERVDTLDVTRRQATLVFDEVRVGPDGLLGEEGSALSVIRSIVRLGLVGLALEEAGGAQWCLETAVDHAKTRYQFGRAIGSFQAVKHTCADMLVAVEHAKSTAYHAARVVDDSEELLLAAPLAQLTCSQAFLQAAGDTIQILGGTGFTWEHDVHFYLKRAKTDSLMFGGARHQRRLLGDAIGL